MVLFDVLLEKSERMSCSLVIIYISLWTCEIVPAPSAETTKTD
jgi:hypothetical protein